MKIALLCIVGVGRSSYGAISQSKGFRVSQTKTRQYSLANAEGWSASACEYETLSARA